MTSRDDGDENEVGLRSQVVLLEEEIGHLRRKLADSPKRLRQLEERLLETKGQLAQASAQNEKLSYTLREAREHISALRDEVDKLTQPPSAYGIVVGRNYDDETVDVLTSGRKMRVNLHPDIEADALELGAEVVLNESFNVVLARRPELVGEVVTVKDLLDDGVRAIVVGRADEELVCELADAVRGMHLRPGDTMRLDVHSNLLLERLPRPEVEDLLLEEVPDISYDDIGGLDEQIEQIADAVELPFLHQELFAEHRLPAPKGILLYGPPGCGKTLIAKAVANSLAKKVAAATGGEKGRSYFINIKGPELLNKYVGETERQIRMVFQRAREKSEEGWPVIVFFDEMDSMFRTRGSGISSDMESTIVPQLLAEIDGVEGLRNVIVIGATNREDLIDPAILRPGRLDVKIKIERPAENAAAQIFARYLTTDIPLSADEVASLGSGDPEAAVQRMIRSTVAEMYRDDHDNRFLEVTYQNGDKEILYFKDFASGAMIENIVRRAKKLAIKRFIAGGVKGVCTQDLLDSIRREYREHEDLPNTTNPDDWAKISGKKGERIVFIRTLVNEGRDRADLTGGRAIERVATGQYL
ncbi:MAG: proteasome ATPase [Ilumatobacteraceae bacterium]|nr:MAG: proteasome ATPase [Actinomycetota bacterium]